MTNKILAAGSVALVGAGSLLGATAAQAYTEADCGTEPTGAFLSLINDDICSLTFNSTSDTNWTVPAGIDRLAAVLVGGGGGSVSFVGGGYAGGGGEVIYVSDVDPTDVVDIAISDGGNFNNNGDAEDTTFGPYTARGGEHGDYDTSLGESGNGNAGAPVDNDLDIGLYGGGAKSAATTSGPGAGYVLSDPELTENDELFPVIVGASAWGEGGNVGEIPLSTGYGEGASATSTDSTVGTQGAIVFRWSLSDMTVDNGSGNGLASTGVDAAPMGIAAAGMLVAGGMGLAIARRARRSK